MRVYSNLNSMLKRRDRFIVVANYASTNSNFISISIISNDFCYFLELHCWKNSRKNLLDYSYVEDLLTQGISTKNKSPCYRCNSTMFASLKFCISRVWNNFSNGGPSTNISNEFFFVWALKTSVGQIYNKEEHSFGCYR